jgi:exonuclease III
LWFLEATCRDLSHGTVTVFFIRSVSAEHTLIHIYTFKCQFIFLFKLNCSSGSARIRFSLVILYNTICLHCSVEFIQASYSYAWSVCFQFLTVSTVIPSSSLYLACLRRSSLEGCLNNIEIYTILKLRLNVDDKSFIIDLVSEDIETKYLAYYKSLVMSGKSGEKLQPLSSFLTWLSWLWNFNIRILYRYLNLLNKFIKNHNFNLLIKALLLLCGDVETNPGPYELTLMTQNCRGLSDFNKLRANLRNKSKMFTRGKAVLALQETYMMNDDIIKWSGNYVMSASASPHSAGCITYLNDYVRVIEVRQIDNFGHGHVIVVDNLLMHPTILANVYSPVRSNGREQENFYNDLFSIIEELERKYLFNEPNLIILGDFNIPLELSSHRSNDCEVKRAKKLMESIEQKGLMDCWKDGEDRFTYKTARSRLDRITYRLDFDFNEKLETDWTFTISDHCLLKVTLTSKSSGPAQSRVISLPTFLLENEELLKMMKEKMSEMAQESADHWEPKVKLEYLKMCLRTVVGEVTKYHNNKVNKELADIRKGISWRMNHISSLPLCAHAENDLQLDLLFTRRNLILEERNKKLAEKAKTKWFHEGEKANKYFLNLLNKRRGINNINRLSEVGLKLLMQMK